MNRILKITLCCLLVSTIFANAQNSKTTDNGVIINGVTWATRNVDAAGTFADKPESAGKVYQWNRKAGWNTEWRNGNGYADNWERATDPSPKGWHVPTADKIQTLLDATKVSRVWTTQNGVKGIKFTDKATGNSLFLPAADKVDVDAKSKDEDEILIVDRQVDNKMGYYWSRTSGHTEYEAKCLIFSYQTSAAGLFESYQAYGMYVRPVADETPTVKPQPRTSDEGVIINGVRWATCNVDAAGTFAATSESAGMFYQWNRQAGWSSIKYDEEDDEEWNSSGAKGDRWAKDEDPSPSGWRVPTIDEIRKLLDTDKVNNVWTTQNGVKGRKFTDKSTGKTLFLPAAGQRYGLDGRREQINEVGMYWSDTPSGIYEAHGFYFHNSRIEEYAVERRIGFSVRPVAIETANKEKLTTANNRQPNNPKNFDKGTVINGVTWATRNIDAPGTFAATPESTGMFYQWNINLGWNTNTKNSNGGSAWYYSSETDAEKWAKVDDPSPEGWRVPTTDEIRKLLDSEKVSSLLTTQNGVKGRKFTDKATGAILFLPAVGQLYQLDGSHIAARMHGSYWSSNRYMSDLVYYLEIISMGDELAELNILDRGYGMSVRPVRQ
jgi:uncharacterized protein (TIGR02145 family)